MRLLFVPIEQGFNFFIWDVGEKVTKRSLYNITHENLKLKKKNIFKMVRQNRMLEGVTMLYDGLKYFEKLQKRVTKMA